MKALLVLVSLLVAQAGWALVDYEVRTVSFEVAELPGSGVRLLWRGEVENNTAQRATIQPAVVLLDAAGQRVTEFLLPPVKVERLTKQAHTATVEVAAEVWERTDAIDQRVAKVAEPLELYGTRWCPHCKSARAYLQAKGVDFTEYDVEAEPDAARRRAALDPRPGVPFAIINGQKILGFSAAVYDQALRGEATGK